MNVFLLESVSILQPALICVNLSLLFCVSFFFCFFFFFFLRICLYFVTFLFIYAEIRFFLSTLISSTLITSSSSSAGQMFIFLMYSYDFN